MESDNILATLTALAEKPQYKIYFNYLRNRRKTSYCTYIDNLTSVLKKENNSEVINSLNTKSFFEELQKAGMGEFDRKGRSKVFKWSYDPVEVGKASMGVGNLYKLSMKDPTVVDDQVIDNQVSSVNSEKKELDYQQPFSDSNEVDISINLPGSRIIKITIPNDFDNDDFNLMNIFLKGHLNRK